MGRVFCRIKYPDGRAFEGDGRYLLGQVASRAVRRDVVKDILETFYVIKTPAS